MLSFTGDLYLKEKKYIDVDFKGELIVNLEYPITKDKKKPAKDKVNLSADAGYLIESLSRKPIGVCLANNHILDFGENGAKETLDYLSENKINFFGFGSKENNYNNPLVYEDRDGVVYEIFAYCDESTSPSLEFDLSVAPLDFELIKDDIYSSNADVKIVCLHWGDEENPYPSGYMVDMAHSLSNLGINAIIGHHAHVIQPYEYFNGCHIFYNLGNLYFPEISEPYGWDGENFKGKYNKIQSKKNQLAMVVDICKFSSDYSIYDYSTGTFVKVSNSLPSMKSVKFKNILFNKFTVIKIMTQRFISNPRVPTVKQIKRFFGG